MKKGFTLAEILVVIAVLAVVGAIITTIFIRNLRGSNKAQIISSIKQNGQSVLENIDKTVRGADNVVCPSFLSPTDTTTSSDTLVTVKQGIYTRYRFISPNNPTPSRGNCQSSNGCFIQDNPTKQIISGQEETSPQFINRVCGSNDPMSTQVVILTDTNPQTGVSVENGLFIRNRSAGFRDLLTINFDLKPGMRAPQVIAGQIDPVTFGTTVQLR